MKLRNSVSNELCATVGRTTTKMNVRFVPRFFICLQAVNTQNTSLSGFLRHSYKTYLEIEEV